MSTDANPSRSVPAVRELLDLTGKLALVTGAGSGLGRSIAVGLARAGALVALADIDAKAGQETAVLIARERSKNPAKVIPCDVTSEQSVRRTCADDGLATHIK